MIHDLNNGSARASNAELDAALAGQEGQFSRGIRSGALGMGAGLNNFAGGVAGALGANEFAQGRYAAADQLAQEAAAAAPRVNSIRDIHGLGDLGDYAAGQIGQLVPAAGLGIGATLLSGGAALPGIVAGTAAMTPLEVGDTIGRQRERGQAVNLGDAAVSGLGSAALQSIVPGMVGAKLAGKAASTAPMTLRRAAGQVGADAGVQGLAGAGGEAAKQLGSGSTLDTLDQHALLDAGVGNAFGGGALGAVGAAGEFAHGKAGAVSEGLGAAKNGATDLLASAKGKLKGAGEAVADAAKPLTDAAGQAKDHLDGYEIPNKLGEMWSTARTAAKDTLRKVADSEDIVGDAKEFAGAQGDKLRAMLAGDDDRRIKAVKSWADELMQEHLTPEQRAAVQDWMASPGDHAKQAAVAGLKIAKDKVNDLGAKLKDFAQRVMDKADEQKGVKKSEDFSGVDAAIGREITPILQEAHPELFTHGGEDARLNAARVIRGLVSELASGKRPSADTVASLIDLLGPKATDMIEAGYRVVEASADKKKTAAFFKGMNEVMGTKDEHLGMVQALRKTLKPEFQRSVSDSELGVEARMLRKWAETGREAGDTDHVFTYKDRKVREGLAARYTDPDAVMAALEKTIPKHDNQIERARPEVDDDGNILGEKGGHGMDREIELAGQRLTTHPAKGGVMYERPEYTPKSKFHQSAVEQRMAKIEGKVKPRLLGIDELGADHPIVEATRANLMSRGEELLKRIRLSGVDEQLGHLTMRPTDTMDFPRGFERDVYEAVRNKGLKGVDLETLVDDALQHHAVPATEVADSPLVLTGDELQAMRLDTKAHGKSKSRIETGEDGPILDAVRMQRFMSDRFGKEYTTGDEKSRVARLGRMFIEAAAAAQEHLGKSFDVPDSLVIGRIGSNDITLGMARKLDPRTKADIAYDETSNKLLELRKAFREASGQDANTGKRVRPKPSNPKELYDQALAQDKVLEKARDDVAKREYAKDSEHIKDEDRQEGNDTSGFGGIVERGLNRRLTHSRPGKDEISGTQTSDRLGDADRSMTQSPRMQRINELRGDMSALSEKIANGTATAADRVKSKAVWNEIEQLLASPDSPLGSGRKEIDPFGPTHDAMRGSEDGAPIFTDSGEARQDGVGAPSLTGPSRKLKNIDALIQGARDVVGMFKRPDINSDTISLRGGLSDYSLRQVNPSKWEILDKNYNVVRTLTAKEPPNPKAVAAKKAALKEAASSGDPALMHELRTTSDAAGLQRAVTELVRGGDNVSLDKALATEHYGHLTTTTAVDKFLADAKRRYAELKAEDSRVLNDDDHPTGRLPDTQMKALATLEKMFGKNSTADLKSFYDGVENTGRAIDEANARLSELVQDPNVAYSLMRDHQRAEGGTGPVDRKGVYEYIKRVLGDRISIAWKDILHAGEFQRMEMPDGSHEDVIRLSIHSLNPLSAAHHEALHGFFERLRDMKQGGVMDVLDRAASSAPVMNQLKKLLADHPEALKQLSDPEERAAYMYQFWAAGKLTIGDHTRNVFQKIADFVRSVLGIWSNDERALHILDYFHSGEFAKDSTKQFARDAVNEKLMAQGRNKAVETVKHMTQPFREMGEALAVAGGARLRDTGIPALRELADAMKLHGTEEGRDAGFLPAARAARAQVMNDLGAKLKGISEASLNAALESLQSKSNDPIKALTDQAARGNAYTAKLHIRNTLDAMYKYMEDRKVDVKDLGVGKDYFPRQYDTSFISSHQQEFKNVLARHGVSNPDAVMKKIVGAEGAEFTVETDKPGMQALKARTLAHIPDAELAPFMRKNVFEIMNSYITQATRRGEWAARFGDKNQRIDALMKQAQREGATPEQMKAAQNFVRSVDGTLGDTINPEARRLIGNMIVYQNIRLLPLAIFSSVVDPLGVVVRGGTVRDGFNTFKRGIAEMAKNFKKNPEDDDMTRVAASMGVIDDTTLVHTLGALYSQGMVGDTGRRINDTFFRYNLMEQFNTSMRVGATEAALGFLKRHADGTASAHSERWLNELGLQKGEVKLDANGRPDITDPKIKMAVNRWVDGAVLRPDAVDKPIWMSDPHFALIAHLKQFVFSFHETILKRVGHEFDHGNYAPAMALASYVPVMMAADFLKGFIQGGGAQPEWKQDWTLADWVQSGVERGGLLGSGQFAMDAFKDIRQGGSGIGALAGPTIEQLTEAVRVMGGREQFGHFAIKSMPANALYAKAFGGEATDPKFVD